MELSVGEMTMLGKGKLKSIPVAAALFCASVLAAQPLTVRDPSIAAMNQVQPRASTSLDFAQYLQLVRQNDLALAAQKAQIDMADAQIALAALFPDPTLTTGLTVCEIMTFTVGVNHSRAGNFLSTPLPQSNRLMTTLAMPIPFSLCQDSDLRAASAATTQAMEQ
jgi:hypothetical protein